MKARPKHWKLTISDLMAELRAGKRKALGGQEIEWAREYERTLLPPDTRFPRKGDVYESLLDQTVKFMTAWRAPFTGGGESLLKKGERVWIDHEPVSQNPIGVYAIPLEYAVVEERMVPEEERNAPEYSDFYLSIKTVDLNSTFTLVEEGYEPKPP